MNSKDLPVIRDHNGINRSFSTNTTIMNDVIHTLMQGRLREIRNVTSTEPVNSGRRRTVGMLTYEDAITAAVERQPWRSSRDITRELECTSRGSSKCFWTVSRIHTTSLCTHMFLDSRPLRLLYL